MGKTRRPANISTAPGQGLLFDESAPTPVAHPEAPLSTAGADALTDDLDYVHIAAVRFALTENDRRILSAILAHEDADRDGDRMVKLEIGQKDLAERAEVARNTVRRRLERMEQLINFHERRGQTNVLIVRLDVIRGDVGDCDSGRQLPLPHHEGRAQAATVGAPITAGGRAQAAGVGAPRTNQLKAADSGGRAQLPSESFEKNEVNSEGSTPEVSKTRQEGVGLWGLTLKEEDLSNGRRMLEFFEVALRKGDGCVEDTEQCRLELLAFAHMKYRQWKRNRAKGKKSSGVALFLHNLRQPDSWGKEWRDHRPSKDDEDWARKQLQPARSCPPKPEAASLAVSTRIAAAERTTAPSVSAEEWKQRLRTQLGGVTT